MTHQFHTEQSDTEVEKISEVGGKDEMTRKL
jgi:hypothetical protein